MQKDLPAVFYGLGRSFCVQVFLRAGFSACRFFSARSILHAGGSGSILHAVESGSILHVAQNPAVSCTPRDPGGGEEDRQLPSRASPVFRYWRGVIP